MFNDALRVKINKEEGKVTLSIRTTDNKVEVFEFPLSAFNQMTAQFNAMLEDEGTE